MTIECLEPFVHVDVIVENDKVYYKPCNVYNKNFDTIEFTNVKNSFAVGQWAEGCDYCKTAESSGVSSRRIGCNKVYNDLGINASKGVQSISFRYGTLCNSTCLICDETRSSAWATKLLQKNIPIQSRYIYKKQLLPTIDKLLTGIDLSQIRLVEFHGGEPLIADYPWEILSKLDKSNLSVKINTNGTVWPKAMQEFNDCKSVEIMFSVDDIDSRLEYLRPPAKFAEVIANIKRAQAMNFKVSCTYVISSLNIFYLPEFLLWALKTFGINLYGQLIYEPSIYSLYNLTEHAKLSIQTKFKEYPTLNKLLQPALDDLNKVPQQDINELIRLANTVEFKNSMPEWSDILTYV